VAREPQREIEHSMRPVMDGSEQPSGRPTSRNISATRPLGRGRGDQWRLIWRRRLWMAASALQCLVVHSVKRCWCSMGNSRDLAQPPTVPYLFTTSCRASYVLLPPKTRPASSLPLQNFFTASSKLLHGLLPAGGKASSLPLTASSEPEVRCKLKWL
jgi:hypothetical protein